MSNPTAKEYVFWRNALAGIEQPVHENEVWPGFWYMRFGKEIRLPVAIWRTQNGLVAKVGFLSGRGKLAVHMGDPSELWTYVCQYPVKQADYDFAYNNGKWYDDPPSTIKEIEEASAEGVEENQSEAFTSDGDPRPNSSPSESDAIKVALDKEASMVKLFISTPITTDTKSNRSGAWAKKLIAIRQDVVAKHKAEKAPHLAAGRAVDQKWFPLRDQADGLADDLRGHLEPYLLIKDKELEEQQQAAISTARGLGEVAEKAIQAANESGDEQAMLEAAELEAEAEDAKETATERPKASAGRTGKKVGLRKTRTAVIVDFDKCYAALKLHPDMVAFVHTLADRACAANIALEGVEFKDGKKAV